MNTHLAPLAIAHNHDIDNSKCESEDSKLLCLIDFVAKFGVNVVKYGVKGESSSPSPLIRHNPLELEVFLLT